MDHAALTRPPVLVAAGLVLLVIVGVTVAALVHGPTTSGAFPEFAPRPIPQGGDAGSDKVELSADVRAHSAGEPVRRQLQAYFSAINDGDYAAWLDTVVPAQWQVLPEAEWKEAYRSTVDGSIRVDRIDDRPDGGLLVRLRFVSRQAVDDAPSEVAAPRVCWLVTLPMTDPTAGPDRNGPPRIERTRDGSAVPTAC